LIDRARRLEIDASPGAEERVWARIDRSRRRQNRALLWATFAAGAACAAGLLVLVHRPAPQRSALVSADRTARAGAKLPLRDQTTAFDLGAAARIVTRPMTLGSIERFDEDRVIVRLDRGSVLLHVRPRRPDSPFEIHTPTLQVKVIGTVLRVQVAADGTSSVAVLRGVVEVRPPGSPTRLVHAGERWPERAANEPSAEELAALERGVAADEPEHPRTDSLCAGPASAELRCYLQRSGSSDPLVAESALFRAGWIALHDLGEPRRALALWEEQAARFPEGVLAEDLAVSLVDVLMILGESSRAAAEANRYLAHYPRSLRAQEMRAVRGLLLVARGRCEMAEADLAEAQVGPSRWAQRARAALASCAASKGSR
jgi:hypothetical protein